MTSTGWTAIYTLLTGGLLVGALLAAWYAHRQWVLAQKHFAESRKAEREASRPYVIVTIESTATSNNLFDLCITNIGKRPAFSVNVSLDPPPRRARETVGLEISNAKMLTEPIAMIAPGQVMRAFYDNHVERKDVEGLPSAHRVAMDYADSSGQQYSEQSTLDIEAMRGAMFTVEKNLHHVAASLGEIESTLKSASVLAREGGLSVDASTEPRRETQRRQEHEEHERTVNRLEIIRQMTPDAPVIGELEAKVAEYERRTAHRSGSEPPAP